MPRQIVANDVSVSDFARYQLFAKSCGHPAKAARMVVSAGLDALCVRRPAPPAPPSPTEVTLQADPVVIEDI